MKRTYVALVIDESGSMQGIKEPTIEAVTTIVDTIRKRAEHEKQETFLSIHSFADDSRLVLAPTNVNNLATFSIRDYRPDGGTALFDTTVAAADLLQRQPGFSDPEVSFLVMPITDGEENRSVHYSKYTTRFKEYIQRLEAGGRWTFAFQVPRGKSAALVRLAGISPDNVSEWEQSARGTSEMAVTQSRGLDTYFEARSKGVTATRNFYAKVTPDLSKLTATQVARQLDDVSSKFKLMTVPDQAPIRVFVESKTKKPYQPGSAFYQLMKSEKVQPQKEVVLLEKTTGAVYAGPAARDLIGLLPGEVCRLNPGNHANYDIFVQSTSTNRILPRGTRLLVDLTR